jgi:uncharacterized protein YdhG (YjbR/CyaY superfamily)
MPGAPKNITEYLKRVSPAQRAGLQKLREQILAVVPSAEECISYSMPAFRMPGGVVAGFLATRKGCSFLPFSGRTLDTLAAELKGYSQTPGSLHFDPEDGLPTTLVRKLLKARQAELASAPAKKKAAVTKKRPVKAPPAKRKPAAKKTRAPRPVR